MRHLVSAGRLNRALEFLPDDDTLAERAKVGTGLTTPELAVLLAYGKMDLSDQVVASDVPEDPYIATTLERYFPAQLGERYPEAMQRHPLRREIIATHVVNSMLNRVGPTFVHRLGEETGATAPDIVRAYLGTRQIFDLVPLWQANDALGQEVNHATRNGIVLATLQLIERGTVWLLHERDALHDMDATIRRFAPGVAEVGAGLERWLVDSEQQALAAAAAQLAEAQVPPVLAQRVARLDAQLSGLDIVEVASELALPVDTVAGVYFGVGGRLALGWLSQQIVALPARSHWQGLARLAMRSDLSSLARELARSVLKDAGTERETETLIERWSAQRGFRLNRCRQLLADLQPLARLDMAMLSVLLRELRSLV
jgi:glutamate dehydrogenase